MAKHGRRKNRKKRAGKISRPIPKKKQINPQTVNKLGVKKLYKKNVWQMRFGPGKKDIAKVFDNLITLIPDVAPTHGKCKYTIYERKGKERNSITMLADVTDSSHIIEAISETLGKIFQHSSRGLTESIMKMRANRDYIVGITIDFDSAITQFPPYTEEI